MYTSIVFNNQIFLCNFAHIHGYINGGSIQKYWSSTNWNYSNNIKSIIINIIIHTRMCTMFDYNFSFFRLFIYKKWNHHVWHSIVDCLQNTIGLSKWCWKLTVCKMLRKRSANRDTTQWLLRWRRRRHNYWNFEHEWNCIIWNMLPRIKLSHAHYKAIVVARAIENRLKSDVDEDEVM